MAIFYKHFISEHKINYIRHKKLYKIVYLIGCYLRNLNLLLNFDAASLTQHFFDIIKFADFSIYSMYSFDFEHKNLNLKQKFH